ncbi:hypothetical protein [uncultured Arcobacter sp.]|uniref:hypothetical protein n=1 Tax=uncultured Arcobacter sp. TaxID=165434 RepID=UPI002633920D|nr:hypothetical protein [uncultured Arcobacter sp.]
MGGLVNKVSLLNNGQTVTSGNPIPTTQQLKIDTVINDTTYDLNAAAYSKAVTPTYDYIIDNVSFEFSTTESRTITITSDNGSKIYESTSTNLSVVLSSINFGQASGQSFTVAITQTAGACTVDITANIKNSPVALTADPVIAEGTNTIGYVGIKDEGGIPVSVDDSTESLQVIDYPHHEIHSGSHYFIQSYTDLSINNVFDIQFTTPNTTKWIHMLYDINSESETAWFIYEGATATVPGTSVTPLNNNRNSINTSAVTAATQQNTSLTNANSDTDVSGATLLASGILGAGRQVGGTAGRDDEIVLKQNTTYCFRIVATAAGYTNFHVLWYEHTDKH